MARYTFSIFEKQFEVPFWGWCVAWLVAAAVLVATLMGIHKLGGGLAVLAAVALTITVTVNDKTVTLIRNTKVRNFIARIIVVAGLTALIFLP